MNKQPDLPEITIVEAEPVEEELPEAVTPESLGLDLSDDPHEAIDQLVGALAGSRKEADSYLDDLRRVAADFDNYRKRSQREMGGLVDRASERVVSALLPVLDSLDAALAVETNSETEEKLKSGVRSTRDQLLDVLAKEGLEPIETFDMPFDPSLHEAVTASGEGNGELIVTDEFRRGYRLKGRVLRASMVGVKARKE
ncbi:MAG TPA: nucleotide exchange factor GrpE [Acidimicrobiia bacterium]|nr:nucleotide exchange factor GrpE [Acidimicrobiia bacterium]